MSFKASADIPLISWSDLHALNAMMQPDDGAKPLNELKLHHRRWMERRLMREMKPSEYVVLSAIATRTLPFNKAIEVIPLSVFTHGVMDPQDPEQHRLDVEGLPIFAGTGLGTSTVQRALAALAEKRLIDRFQVPGQERNAHAYMPVSALTLYFALTSSAPAAVTEIPDRIMKHIKATPAVEPLEEAFQARWTAALDRNRERHDAA